MGSPLRYLGQAAFYAALALVIGYLSDRPAYTHFPPDRALIKLALVHGGQPITPCRRLGREELAKLPPNMRRPQECPRERVPLLLEVLLDGRTLYRASLPPTGLAKDGPSRAYQRFAVPPGRHEVTVRLRDGHREDGFDYELTEAVELAPAQNLAIDFRPETGGFILR
ncbi:MAG TPA: hypothetical protein VFG43_03860 [Geminicoccaceae bacterium]|nr:hypothetical protein [Geminicoccaceae bacterium]